MSTGPFSCPWDSGQVGFIYVEKKKVKEEWGWNPKYDLDKMTRDMIEVLNKKLEK